MALHSKNSIDVILNNPKTGTVDLILYDDGAAKDELQRYNLVLEKGISYLEYVASGQLVNDNPEIGDKPVRCCVICKRKPNEVMLKLEAIKDRNDPSKRLDVVVLTETEYLGQPVEQMQKNSWWKIW
jgi:hypothetical protein